MSSLTLVQERIQSTTALIARHQQALASPTTTEGDSAALSVNLRSLQNLQKRLEEQFLELAALQRMEVYRYRILVGDQAPALAGIGDAWAKLQDLFAAIYKSLTMGPDPSTSKLTSSGFGVPELGYAYSFPGSVGVVVTLPQPFEAGLLQASPVEETSNTVFDMLESPSLNEALRELGPEPILAFKAWLEVHTKHHYGADIEWNRDNKVVRHKQVSYDQIVQLQTRLLDTKTRSITINDGTLTAVDTDRRTFRFKPDSGKDIEGRYEEGVIQMEHKASVPSRYTATIATITDIAPPANQKHKPEVLLQRMEPL